MESINKNDVIVSGEVIDSKPKFSHTWKNEKYYQLHIAIRRRSETLDIIPVVFAESMIDAKGNYKGAFIEVQGYYSSRNVHTKKKSKLILQVFAESIVFIKNPPYYGYNKIELEGFLCKKPIYRITPSGIPIADILVASNMRPMESNYIPCICWNAGAGYTAHLAVGAKVVISGRIQSREYTKKISEDKSETRIAYEVSVTYIKEIKDGNNRVKTD